MRGARLVPRAVSGLAGWGKNLPSERLKIRQEGLELAADGTFSPRLRALCIADDRKLLCCPGCGDLSDGESAVLARIGKEGSSAAGGAQPCPAPTLSAENRQRFNHPPPPRVHIHQKVLLVKLGVRPSSRRSLWLRGMPAGEPSVARKEPHRSPTAKVHQQVNRRKEGGKKIIVTFY